MQSNRVAPPHPDHLGNTHVIELPTLVQTIGWLFLGAGQILDVGVGCILFGRPNEQFDERLEFFSADPGRCSELLERIVE